MSLYNDIPGIIQQFAVCGDGIQIEPIKKGYINQTYKVETVGMTVIQTDTYCSASIRMYFRISMP